MKRKSMKTGYPGVGLRAVIDGTRVIRWEVTTNTGQFWEFDELHQAKREIKLIYGKGK